MCEGPAVAHAHGVVHRDLKPSNVLFRHVDDTHRQALAELTPDVEPANEELLLADFGIARRLEAVTHTQRTMGTVLYMTPEQFAGSGDHRVDIYSAAVLLHEFVTNEPPFPEEH
jgi:serine/threonine protein kinase